MIFKNKSELQVVIVVISFTLLFSTLGLLLLSLIHPLFLIPTIIVSLLYVGITIIEKNYDAIAVKVEEYRGSFTTFKIFKTYSFLSIFSFILLIFNTVIILLLLLFNSNIHPWLEILAFLLMGVSLYFGIVFGFAALFNKVKKRLFAIISLIGHLGFFIVAMFFIIKAFFELLALMFFGA
jgi:hypothetical protein